MVEVVEDAFEVVGADGTLRSFASLADAEQASGQLRQRQVTRRVPGVFRVDADGVTLGEFDRVADANMLLRAHPGARIVVVAKT
jgi:hypothetical protein